jgi:hypothetical protein
MIKPASRSVDIRGAHADYRNALSEACTAANPSSGYSFDYFTGTCGLVSVPRMVAAWV